MSKRDAQRKELTRKLKNAQVRYDRAEKVVEECKSELSWLDELDALDTVTSWGGQIDWNFLVNNRTTTGYTLCDFFLEKIGLKLGMDNSDTLERIVNFGVFKPEDENDAMSQVRETEERIKFILPHLKPMSQDGLVSFGIKGEYDSDHSIWSMNIAPDLSEIYLKEHRYCKVIANLKFEILAEALIHIQDKFPTEWDPRETIKYPPRFEHHHGQMLKYGLEAFLRGCQAADHPVPNFFTYALPAIEQANASTENAAAE